MKRVFSKSKDCGMVTSASARREAFVKVLKNGIAAASYPETIIASWRVSGMWPVNKEDILRHLPDSPPEWAQSEIEPKKAPEGASYGAVYRASDRLENLYK
ncbi:uncharacterized protein MONOS_7807 [Monocercomonoides exilis]|uniref:uncharacterized protein n=1 Tax=Monocercomonoides exilis TaxID=2049356 RepID=UPI003559EDCF|nr:hypothetical protein MONOS_7807 [Monocercomonoides exilis]|eukprot:MONOS_7807.1-p1 / transcript=MONOS_7807.1 / gene=MONOS_7807 / organism=Monocercomonoides_exilis_PA203 / gene_product=unspecified product / transcript_product=unspecified product / location=Mono_scaffold00277:19728-20030(-) / protein_length=101 / sequence_SO=supercontig / SO=protein_coding / is_pseudo=false